MTQRAMNRVSAAALLPGAAAVAWIIGLIGLPILTLAAAAPAGRIVETLSDPYVHHVAWFSL